MRPSIADDLREIRRATKAVKKIARDIAETFGPSPVPNFAPSPSDRVEYIPSPNPRALPAETQIPQNYSYVRCVTCSAPALLVRDDANQCFAAMCVHCSTISHLETIVEEGNENAPQKR